jgi:UPF0716 family protein affecting phage T7 exclusion
MMSPTAKRYILCISIIVVPVVEIGLILLLANYIGVWWILLAVALSTATGLVNVVRQWKEFTVTTVEAATEPSREVAMELAAQSEWNV